MTDPGMAAEALAEVLAQVRALRADNEAMRVALAALISRPASAPPPSPPLLLSRRRAAEMLGVDRGTTLAALIADGALRVVHVGGKERIPLAEIERLAVEGPRRSGSQRKAPRPPTRATRGGDPEVGRILALRSSAA